MRGKKGIELSVNFIVMLILAIVLFGFGLYFASTLFKTSYELIEEDPAHFDQTVKDLACFSADKVCVPISTTTVDDKGVAITGVVIENVLGEKKDFQIYAEVTILIDKAGNEIYGFDKMKVLILPSTTHKRVVTIDNREKKSVPIAVQPTSGESGTYAFNVYVDYKDASGAFTTGSQYSDGRPLKFYVVVP